MSLARVGSVDGFDRERRGSTVSQQRRMSFNPISDWVPPRERGSSVVEAALAFEEVSKEKRLRAWPPLGP